MNKHILLVMKYLDDNNSVTQGELLDNCKAAADAYSVVVSAAAYAAYAASATTTAADAHFTKNTIDRYFVCTGENKQDYIDEITKNKGE